MTPFSRAHFESLLNEPLPAVPLEGGASATLTLERVQALPVAKDPESFGLTFRGPLAPALAQGLFLFDRPGLPREPLFLVPVGRDAEGLLYEAVFNRG